MQNVPLETAPSTDDTLRLKSPRQWLERVRKEAARARYEDVRDRIRTGDVILFRGRGLLSRIIRRISGGYSHSGIAAWWGDRLLVFQAALHGTQVLPLSAVVETYDGQVDWWGPTSEISERFHNKLIDAATETLGKPFSVGGLLRFAWRLATRQRRDGRDPSASPRALFCSQYVSYCYVRAGLDLLPDKVDAYTSPSDLACSGMLEVQAVLRRS